MDVEEALAVTRQGAPDPSEHMRAADVLAPVVERYRAVEAKLRGLAAGAEHERVGGGVNAGSLGTEQVRKAFGWPLLPEPLMPGPDGRAYVAPLEYYAEGVPVEVRFGEEWRYARTVCRNIDEGTLASVTVELGMWGSAWRGDIANPELIRPLAPTSLRSGGEQEGKSFSERLDELGVDEPGAAERGFVTPLQEYVVDQRVMILWGSPNVWTAAKVESVSVPRVVVRVSSGCRERQVWIYDAREIRPVAW